MKKFSNKYRFSPRFQNTTGLNANNEWLARPVKNPEKNASGQ